MSPGNGSGPHLNADRTETQTPPSTFVTAIVSQTSDEGAGPRFQVMPALSADEYAALRDDIAERGVVVPVVVDQQGRLLDGHHRQQIAEELGIDCPTEVHHVRDDDDARDVALALNLARRHLSRDQRRELIRQEIEARPDDSDRAIARRFGCDHKTVGAVRREGGEIPQSSKLDTPALTFEEAEECLEKALECASVADEDIARAFRGGVDPMRIVAMLMDVLRVATEKGGPEEVLTTFRTLFIEPRVRAVLGAEEYRADVAVATAAVEKIHEQNAKDEELLAQVADLGEEVPAEFAALIDRTRARVAAFHDLYDDEDDDDLDDDELLEVANGESGSAS
jgi:hypothetical protein